MDKRVIVFLLISLAVIVGYDYLLKEFGLLPLPPEQQPESPPAARTDAGPSTEPPPVVAKDQSVQPSKRDRMEGPSDAGGQLTDEQTVEVETDLYRARLSNRGGVIKSWELKRYTVGEHDKKQPVQLVYQA
ncbi:MAG TPA: membrane protein insertase YidC, partial [Nitrospiraceae bacterium]|nr:membrane protein insertase YidC [Nitrospiraceae bacterium]